MVFVDGERRVCFLLGYVPSFKMDQKNLHLLIIAAIIGAMYQATISEQNGTWHNMLLHVMQRRAHTEHIAQHPPRAWTMGVGFLQHHAILTAFGSDGGQIAFIPRMNQSSFLCTWILLLQGGLSLVVSLSTWGSVFTPTQTNCTSEGNVRGPNSSGLKMPLDLCITIPFFLNHTKSDSELPDTVT